MNPPFLTPKFSTTIPATKPGGLWNWSNGPWEDGASIYANSGPVIYNGQTQSSSIAAAYPKPPRSTQPASADKSMSKIP